MRPATSVPVPAYGMQVLARPRTASGSAEPGWLLREKPPSAGAVWSAKGFRRSVGGLSFDQPFHVRG